MAAKRKRLTALAFALAVPVVAGGAAAITLSVTSDDRGPVNTGAPGEPRIGIRNFAYEPHRLTVHAGAEIVVENLDDAVHTVTSEDGTFDTGDLGGDATITFGAPPPGRYRYFCAIHNYMRGVIRVVE